MTELTIELDRLIQKAALDGALTQDAVAQFHSVLKKCDAQTDKIEELEKANADAKKEHVTLNASFSQISTKLSDYQTRERELEEREQENLKLQLEAKHQGERVEDHKEMVKLVFRNLEVRRNVFPVSPSTNVTESGMHGMGGMVEERQQSEKTE